MRSIEKTTPSPDNKAGTSEKRSSTAAAAPLGLRTASGFAWLAAQTAILKVVGIGGQILLAWFLDKEDFALIGLAGTVTAFTTLVQQAGLTEILVQRQRHYRRWASPAFWMSLATGTLSGLLTLAAAPAAARIYHSQTLVGLLTLLAIAAPLSSVGAVLTAQLQIQLRFQAITVLGLIFGTANIIITVVFARLGAGAYSFILPRLILPPVQALILWHLAEPEIRRSPQIRRWRYLLGDSSVLLAIAVLGTITMQGDNIVLGIICTKREMGAYIFAFNLMIQAMSLLSANLSGVLFPALSKLNAEPSRQSAAFLRSIEVLAVVGVPICLLQGALARPILQILFGTKWNDAIPILQWGSISVSFGLLNAPAMSLIQAQGRFTTVLRLSGFAAAVFVALVIPGAVIGRSLGAAVTGCIASAVVSIGVLSAAIRGNGSALSRISSILLAPFFAGALAVGTGWSFGALVTGTRGTLCLKIGVVTVSSLLIYVSIMRKIAPAACLDLAGRLRDLVARATQRQIEN